MRPELNVYALPSLVEPADLTGATAIVIDVLRASTTIITALEAGAKEVAPCTEVGEARRLAADFPAGEAVLGGERGGTAVEGFELGNSPREYHPGTVEGRTVVYTTTNGTRALFRCRAAAEVLVAGFVNVSAVCRRVAGRDRIAVVCAGTDGEVSEDDVLLAGMIAERTHRQRGMTYQLNAQALTARENWLAAFALPIALGSEPLPPPRLAARLRTSRGGKALVPLGMDADILSAAHVDCYRLVPVLDPQSFRLRPAVESHPI